MRLLPLILMLLTCWSSPATAGELPSSSTDMVHLSVIATGVRLRAGAGTEFAIVGMASRKDPCACRFVALATPGMDSQGIPWFKLLGRLERQEEQALIQLDKPVWIRSDFVKTRALSPREIELAESLFFRTLTFAPSLLTSFSPASPIPAFSDEKLCYFPQEHSGPDLSLPAGEPFLLFNALRGEQTCVGLWKAVDKERIRFAGAVPLDAFLKADMGADSPKVDVWLKKEKLIP